MCILFLLLLFALAKPSSSVLNMGVRVGTLVCFVLNVEEMFSVLYPLGMILAIGLLIIASVMVSHICVFFFSLSLVCLRVCQS